MGLSAISVMGGIGSDMFEYFKILMLQGMLACRKHHERLIAVVEIMMAGSKRYSVLHCSKIIRACSEADIEGKNSKDAGECQFFGTLRNKYEYSIVSVRRFRVNNFRKKTMMHSLYGSLYHHDPLAAAAAVALMDPSLASSNNAAAAAVTMKDRTSAEQACKDPNPIIDGRKANVNLAYLGAKPRNNLQLVCSLQTFYKKQTIQQKFCLNNFDGSRTPVEKGRFGAAILAP
uniref:Uncharacterized protein n=1 Tax=Romanomermis culicivorax TaxID=13658 RepID=A0A915J9C1_ROMCU